MAGNVYWIEGPWLGKLAIIARPRGDEWLIDEVNAWQQTGLDVIISLLTDNEARELGLEYEQECVENNGLQYLKFPIVDRSIPSSFRAARNFIENLTMLLSAGKSLGVHCRQGVGRSALVAASALVASGISVDQAFKLVETARGCPVPDTPEQRQWVERLAILESVVPL